MDSRSERLQSKGWWADQIRHVIDRAKSDGYYVRLGVATDYESDREIQDLCIYDNPDSSFGIVIFDEGDE